MYFPGITRNPSSNSLTPHPALTPTRLHAPPTLLTPHPSPLPSSGSPLRLHTHKPGKTGQLRGTRHCRGPRTGSIKRTRGLHVRCPDRS